jgi:hypothetical protein
MVKKILLALILSAFITHCFAGYSSGGRSGYSGGSRSYSSSSMSRSSTYSTGRSGYSSGRSGFKSTTPSIRSYNQPLARQSTRQYSSNSANTVINNHHYSQGGGYGLGGGGFFNGFLGGYLGGTLANSGHHTTVMAGGAPVMTQGQGMLMEGQPAFAPSYGYSGFSVLFTFVLIILFLALLAYGIFSFANRDTSTNYSCNHNSRW